jgi:hypothetical protein
MQWEIRGTRKGKPGQWRIQASTAESAKAKAVGAGVTVEQVKPFTEAPPKADPAPAPPSKPAPAAVEQAEEDPVDAVVVADDENEEEEDWTHIAPEQSAPVLAPAVPVPISYQPPPQYDEPVPAAPQPIQPTGPMVVTLSPRGAGSKQEPLHVQFTVGEAFHLGFFAALGAWCAMLILSVIIFIVLLIAGAGLSGLLHHLTGK